MGCVANLVFDVSSSQPHMPLFSIYSLALEQDQEQSVGLQQASNTLHTQTFVQVNVTETCCSQAHSIILDSLMLMLIPYRFTPVHILLMFVFVHSL